MNRILFHPAFTLALLLGATGAWAAGKSTQAQQDYQQERARCLRGDSGQERATCLKEAGAAYEEARRNRLGQAPGADLARNATQRCDAQAPADREACVQRILGAGTTEGSVKDGGLIRRSETKSE
jgi:hypothetical protein